MGSSLLTLFLMMGVPAGRTAVTIAHIMFCISFVVVTVKARVATLDPRLEEAAADLGANPVPDVPAGHLPAGGPRHRRRRAAGVLAQLRRLHHHQLQREPELDHVPDVRLGCRAARCTGAGQRHRHDHVPHRAVRRRHGPGLPEPSRPRRGLTTESTSRYPVHVLMVGAGGVGDAVARIAAERPFFDAWVVGRLRPRPAPSAPSTRSPRAHEGETRFRAAQVDASDAGAVAALAREAGATHVFNAVDPRFVLPIFDGRARRRCRLPRHGDEPVEPAPERARTRKVGRQARRRPVRAGGGVGGRRPPRPRRHRRRARALRRVRPLRGRPPVQRRSTSSAPATAPTSSSATRTATRSSRPASRSGRPSRSA